MMTTLLKLAFVLALLQVSVITAEKAGICPPRSLASIYGACIITCGNDEHCEGSKKCCDNGCGAWCSEPTCPQGLTKVNCPSSLCTYVGCPGKARNSLRCSIDFCNQCKVSFHNVTTGDLVDCGPVETLCPRMLAAKQKHLFGKYIPVCDSKGAFKPIQCHEGYCFCVDKTGIPDMSTSVRGNPKCPEKTLCQQQIVEANKLPPIGRFVPQCNSDGSFKERQCHASTGQCWCVDSNGREWFGTRSREKLDCTSVCPAGVTQLKCDPMICNTATCPGYKKAVCRVNPCGQCKPEFLDEYNRKVQCVTKCQSLRMEALVNNKPARPLVGHYVPQCSKDGKFEQIQCYGSTGYCWCVDNNGSPVLGTIVRGLPHCKSSDVGVCPPGRPMFSCLWNFCNGQTCPAYPNAKCRVNPCGTCKAEFVDNKGSVITNCNKGISACQQERAKALKTGLGGLQPVGRFVPECASDGNYTSIQCWGSVGFCWCVNGTGKEITGTRVRGRPDCTKQPVPVKKDGFCPFKQPRDAKFCSSAAKCTADNQCVGTNKCCNSTCGKICQAPIITACPNGRPFLLCLHMCAFSKCPGNPTAQCFSDPCSMCRVEFRDANGNKVDCSKGLTPCQLRRQRSMGLLGAFRPQCDAKGNYEAVQQHEGYYWCVDSTGREINGTRKRFSKPTCLSSGLNSSMTLCQLQIRQTAGARPLVGRYVPKCEQDGSFSQVQCHPSTGYCWCVNKTSGVVVPNTQIRGQPNCNRVCSPVMCRMYCQYGFTKDQFGCGICKCASAPITPGICPAVDPKQVGICVESCKQDSDCAGGSKCCSNGCGHVCTSAVLREKPGVCPHRPVDHVGICMNKCGDDKDCQGNDKCCSNGCGRQCSTPVRKACPYGQPLVMCLRNPCQLATCPTIPKATCRPNYCGGCKAEFYDENNQMVKCTSGLTLCQTKYLQVTSKGPMIGAFIPQCDKNGAFFAMQCHASTGYCGCVDPDTGVEIPNTKRAPGTGTPLCNTTTSTGPKCPANQQKRFSLCKGSLCENTNCTRFPNARCVVPMGTCGVCKPKYYDYDGSEVQCLTECQQKALGATQGGLLGAYAPTCNADGTYTLIQCHHSIGYCWCVFPDGREWPGTRARGQPKCLRKRSESEISKVHVKLIFKNDFQLVNNSLQDFITVLKTLLSERLGMKTEQITELSVTSGSIVVEFDVVSLEGGSDINTLAQHIDNEVRRENIVVTYGGVKFVASPNNVQAAANYKPEEKDPEDGGDLGTTHIALICVFTALAIVVLAVVVVMVKRKRNRPRSNTDDQTGILYRDGRAESYSTTSGPPPPPATS